MSVSVVSGHQLARILDAGKISDICLHRRRMQLILNHCENIYVPYDGEFLRHMKIKDGQGATDDGLGQTDKSRCAGVVPDGAIKEDDQDPICRQTFPARKQSAITVYADRVYASGGYTEQSVIGSDVWYRGECRSVWAPKHCCCALQQYCCSRRCFPLCVALPRIRRDTACDVHLSKTEVGVVRYGVHVLRPKL